MTEFLIDGGSYPDDEVHPDLGPCCACGESGPTVRNVGFLDKKCRVPGHGWGCVQCGLEADGAIIVVCDACAAKGKDVVIRWACRGYPGTEGRVPIERLKSSPVHRHDLSKHPEVQQATCAIE